MLYHIIAIALSLSSCGKAIATATPESFPETFPIADLNGISTHPNFTLGSHGVEIPMISDASFDASLIVYSSVDCIMALGPSQIFNLSTTPLGRCITTLPFESVAIFQFSGAGLPFEVLIGPAGCGSFSQIPAVNMCFNLNPFPLGDFLLEQ